MDKCVYELKTRYRNPFPEHVQQQFKTFFFIPRFLIWDDMDMYDSGDTVSRRLPVSAMRGESTIRSKWTPPILTQSDENGFEV